MRRRAFLSGLGAALARPGTIAAAEAAPSAAGRQTAFAPVRSALSLSVADETGAAVPLSRYSGRLIVLNLWGPWCVPCRREMPSLSRLAARLDGQNIAVLPLAFDWRGAKAVRAFYDEYRIANLPTLIGKGDNLDAVLGLSRLPTTALIDAKGDCFALVAGEATWDDDATVAWLAGLA